MIGLMRVEYIVPDRVIVMSGVVWPGTSIGALLRLSIHPSGHVSQSHCEESPSC